MGTRSRGLPGGGEGGGGEGGKGDMVQSLCWGSCLGRADSCRHEQGSFRHTLLDLLQCMGVEVQKNMHLPRITHVVALDVEDTQSAKLNAARQ